jgi:formate dehydrogenase subunit delta
VSNDRLIYMANQIAANFVSLPEKEAAAAVAEHIRMFWSPRMRAQLCTVATGAESGANPIVVAALRSLEVGPMRAG